MTPQQVRVVICAPAPVATRTMILYCPRCKRRRKAKVKSFQYYGPMATCTALRRRWKHVVKACGYLWIWD